MDCDVERDEPRLVKLVVLGEAGAGVTSFLGALGDFAPVVNAELARPHHLDDGGALATGFDPSRGVLPVDYSSCVLHDDLLLGLWGVSGIERAAGPWLDLMRDAAGTVVLTRSDRVERSYPVISALEAPLPDVPRVPFSLAVNLAGDHPPTSFDIRQLLELPPPVPITFCDARNRASARSVVRDLFLSLRHGADPCP